MAEWIELWDPEAMMSYTGRSAFEARSAQVGWSFFPQVHIHDFSPLNKPKVS